MNPPTIPLPRDHRTYRGIPFAFEGANISFRARVHLPNGDIHWTDPNAPSLADAEREAMEWIDQHLDTDGVAPGPVIVDLSDELEVVG